jgi:RimJ/RimL family protein N-acetyltransferase
MELCQRPNCLRVLPEEYSIIGERLSTAAYLTLYREIGGPVGWDTRLLMSEAELAELLSSSRSTLYLLRHKENTVGICEFYRSENKEAELQHFGLAASTQGKGLGLPFLLNATAAEFDGGITRIWLHTDEWDNPASQQTYAKAGFTVYDRRFMDPTPL